MLKNIFIIFLLIFIIIIFSLQIYCCSLNKCFHELLYPNDYIVFNEYKYLPTKNLHSYLNIVNRGYNIMKQKKLVIGGLFQNSSKVFYNFKTNVNKLANYFDLIQVVIFENDSIDNSRTLLLNWEKEQNNIHIIKCKENNFCLLNNKTAIDHGITSNNRMIKMSKYRNIVKFYVDKHFTNYDYFMVIDTDARGGFSLNGLAYSFGINSHWDMISAYGVSGPVLSFGYLPYHDYIALCNNIFSFELIFNFIFINSINSNYDLIPVKHAFGGLSIYNMNSIRSVDYTPLDNIYMCEHTIFTNNMINNGFNKLFINPKLLFLMGKQGANFIFFF